MDKKYRFLIAAFMLFSAFASASPQDAMDPFNTYIWNRQNVVAGNGQVDTGDWFEWWYYKVIDPATGQPFFFTYGIVNPWDTSRSLAGTKAVVQAGDYSGKFLVDQEYPVSQFKASYDNTDVTIGANHATDKHIQGSVSQNGHEMAWDLAIQEQWKFDAMGWSMGTGDLSGIYWYPAQAAAVINGWIRVDGKTFNLTAAPAYQDRNWGRSFPKWWTWLVSNGFKNAPDTVLAAGGGEPKVLNSVYLLSGLCIGLKHNGHEYIFRSTDGNYVNFDIRWGVWNVVAENGRNERIEISGSAPPDKFMMLPFQSPRGPIFYDYETLLGNMTVKVYTRGSIFENWKQVADLESDQAGIEWGTPTQIDVSKPFSFEGYTSGLTR